MANDALQALFALAKAHAEASRVVEASGTGFNVLRLLSAIQAAPENCRRPTNLARELRMTPSGITRALDSLTAQGLIAPTKDPLDARAVQAALTPAGVAALEKLLAAGADRAAHLLRRLSVGQIKQLQRLLEEVGR